MVKLKGAGLAAEAAGSIAKTLTFSKSKGRAYAKLWAAPKNPKSSLQTSNRVITAFCSHAWKDLSAAQKATWNDRAAAANISPFNALQSHGLTRWTRFLYPAVELPDDETGHLPAISTWIPTVISRGIRHYIYSVDTADGSGFPIHRNAAPGLPATYGNLKHIQPCLTGNAWYWNDHPLPPGTYYYLLTRITKRGRVWAIYITRGPYVVT